MSDAFASAADPHDLTERGLRMPGQILWPILGARYDFVELA